MHVRLGVVGSRRRNTLADRAVVSFTAGWFQAFASALFGKYDFVSGGCREGADAFIKDACALNHHPIIEELPAKLPSGLPRWQYAQANFARNEKIVRRVKQTGGAILALVAEDRKGGTEDTLRHAVSLAVPQVIHLPDGDVESILPIDLYGTPVDTLVSHLRDSLVEFKNDFLKIRKHGSLTR